MKNPFGDQQIPEPPGSYQKVKERIYRKVSADINDKLKLMLQNSYERALGAESIVLIRSERKRLLSQITQMVMEDIIKKLDGGSAK